MPSPPPNMVKSLSHLRLGGLDDDLMDLINTNVLSTQAFEMLNAEATRHTERLFLTLMLAIVNQNAIHQKQVEELKDDIEEIMTKHANLTTAIANCFKRIDSRHATPPNATPPPSDHTNPHSTQAPPPTTTREMPPATLQTPKPPSPIDKQRKKTYINGKPSPSEDATKSQPPPRYRKARQTF
ncbi:uncharacterized protein LAJ45_11537 [Morchella importuna]|uniref:uncharacterized protein n=1 Tax=Morchella importuna TaxID=1174673 RepID=UPI001E8EE648|nr:uncharacterized protein LAJ45_11537 [Morchella importuna]KAH8144472.1 hypothetical protein LAJ45_11537 [Morchella importuna]